MGFLNLLKRKFRLNAGFEAGSLMAYGGVYMSGFQPSNSFCPITQAFGLGWYMSGRWP
jgi:hypothetical protein